MSQFPMHDEQLATKGYVDEMVKDSSILPTGLDSESLIVTGGPKGVRPLPVGLTGQSLQVVAGAVAWAPTSQKNTFVVSFAGMPSSELKAESYLRAFGSCDGASDRLVPTSRNAFYCTESMEIESIAVFRSLAEDPESIVQIYYDETAGPIGKFGEADVGTKPLTNFSGLPFTIPRACNIYASITPQTSASNGCVNIQLLLKRN